MRIAFFIALFALVTTAQAQPCLPGVFNFFGSQQEVDLFKIQNPNCTVIEGDLTISGSDITNLNGLSNINTILGTLYITDCDALTDLNGLSNLISVGSLFLDDNDALTSMVGLNKLDNIGTVFYIQGNAMLQSLNGLQNLKTIGGDFWINSAPELTSLEGFNNLTNVGGSFDIEWSWKLADISALGKLKSVGSYLRFYSTEALLNLNGLNQLESIGGGLVLFFNQGLQDITALGTVQGSLDSVFISGNFRLKSLDGLQGITGVDADLRIQYCDSLLDLSSLNTIASIGGDLIVLSNPMLLSLHGLESLQNVGGSVHLLSNPMLPDLQGLEGLQSIGGSLRLQANVELNSIAALSNLGFLGGDLQVHAAFKLADLNGLQKLTSIGGGLDIAQDSLLFDLSGLDNVTQIGGDVRVDNCSKFHALTGLEKIMVLPANLIFNNCPKLENLLGLQNLHSVGGYVFLGKLDSLQNMNGFDNLETVGGDFTIQGNSLLVSLDGLGKLAGTGGRFAVRQNTGMTRLGNLKSLENVGGDFEIFVCPELETLDSLPKLTNINGKLSLTYNYKLLDIKSLENLTNIFGGVEIQSNYALTDCAILPFCQKLFNEPATCSFSGNGTGCNNNTVVQENCSKTTLTVLVKTADNNCQFDTLTALAVPRANVQLETLGQNDIFPSDSSGTANFRYYQTGSPLTVSLTRFPAANWEVCGNTVQTISPASDTTVVFLLKPLNQCPEVAVKLALPSVFSDCAEATTASVFAENIGSIEAQNVRIGVVFPQKLNLLSAQPNMNLQTGDTLFFDIGNLAPLARTRVELSVKTTCGVLLAGETVCWSAFSEIGNGCPDNPTAHSNIRVSGECLGNIVRFTLKNTGTAATQGLHEYALIRNQTLQTTVPFSLAAGDTLLIDLPADGATYRIEATKFDNGTAHSAKSVEGCGGLTVGNVTAFWLDPGDRATEDFDCREYSPDLKFSGKSALPVGLGPEHLTPPNRPLRYTYDFHNWEAFTTHSLSLNDILPAQLDAGSVRAVAASHPFSWKIRNGNELNVLLEPAMIGYDTLVPNTSDSASHGFFTFEIDQKPDLEIGTRITNSAFAYFNESIYVGFDSTFNTISAADAPGLSCLPDGLLLSSQTEVDSFPVMYPDCSRIGGGLTISGADITDLTPLSSLQAVGGTLTIITCPGLKSLAGLHHLASVGGSVLVQNMDSLISLAGLNKLYKIGDWLQVLYCPQLPALAGLENLIRIGGLTVSGNSMLSSLADFSRLREFNGSLEVNDCPMLTNLTGLDSLQTIGGNVFLFSTDAGLTDLTALRNLRRVGSDLAISLPLLTSLQGLESLDSVGAALRIWSCQALLNFQGLNHLLTVGNLDVYNNNVLQNMDGLDSLTHIQWDFNIVYNPALSDFTGLENLQHVGHDFYVQSNISQTSFQGLGNLKTIGNTLGVVLMDSLSNMIGMGTLDSIGGDFYVRENPVLASFDGLTALRYVHGNFMVQEQNPAVKNFVGLENLRHIGSDFTPGDSAQNLTGLDRLEFLGGTFLLAKNFNSFAGANRLAHIGGSLTINKLPQFLDFNGLNALKTIGGDLQLLSDWPNETSFAGLDSLETVGGVLDFSQAYLRRLVGLGRLKMVGSDLKISYQLENFHEMVNLQTIGGEFYVGAHDSMSNFLGLHQLDSIGGNFSIDHFDRLTTLAGLENLRAIGGDFWLQSSYGLSSLSPLKKLESVGGYISIFANQALAECSIYALCERLAKDPGGNTIYIALNAAGCDNNAVVAAACNAHPTSVHARVLVDENGDCLADAGDTPLPNVPVLLQNSPGSHIEFRPTDSTGLVAFEYFSYLPLSLQLPGAESDFWEPCQSEIGLALTSNSPDTLLATFLMTRKTQLFCPELTTTLALPSNFRSCLTLSEVQVSTQNTGSDRASEVQTAVIVPPVMEVLNTEPSPDFVSGDTLFFESGELHPFQFSVLKLQVRTRCDSFLLGQTLCWEAFSTLKNPCPTTLPAFSEIKLSAACLADTAVRFTITNIGDAPTQAPHEYRVIRNAETFQTANFSLTAHESLLVDLPADGATWRMEATKLDGGTLTAVALENCKGLTPGYINAFWLEKGPAEYDFACREVIGAFDPNQKTAVPTGAGPDNLLEQNITLQYTIDFQNTGTDTAFRVLLLDILPPNTDATTFRPVFSSHPYTWQIRGADSLEVLFFPIMLPDSNVNEPASHGFFTFDIEQKPDLPDGTVFENTASIIFDYNPPIVTNTVRHTIGRLTVAVDEPQQHAILWRVLGNPVHDAATFQSTEDIPGEKRFDLFDPLGRPTRTARFSGRTFEFRREGLAAGWYVFRISDTQGRAFSGKIIVVD